MTSAFSWQNLFMKSLPPWPNYIPNVPLPNTITLGIRFLLGASVKNPARDKVMRKEADIRKACSDFRDPSGNS